MELYFLDENFAVTDIVDGFSSIVWSEKFHDVGTFTLHFPREYVPRVRDAAYVRTPYSDDGSAKCGRIECLSVGSDGDCKMSGHTLEVLLSDRVISGRGVYSGTVTDAVLSAVRNNLRGCGVTVADDQPLISDEVSLAYGYDRLSTWLYSTLKPYGASFRVTLGPDNTPLFTLVIGADRSSGSASGEQAAVFSSSFGNIVSFEYEKNTTETKNTAYVEGDDGTVVTVDRSGGAKIREVHHKADDIVRDDFATEEEYEAALCKRGLEVLAKQADGMRVSAECDFDALPRYGEDYFLGDVCDVCDGTVGLSFALRLTQADTVWERGRMTVFPSFGDEIRSVKAVTDSL